MKDCINIHNEEGDKEDDLYEIIKCTTGTKNVIEIKNCGTGEKRMIHKDRTFLPEKRSKPVEKKEKKAEAEEEVKKTPKKAKKKKVLEKFDLKEVEDMGVLFRSKKKNSMEVSDDQKIAIESFCVVSDDAMRWKHFNLYNHSLGKKERLPNLAKTIMSKENFLVTLVQLKNI